MILSADYIPFVHVPYFLKSPLAITAPRNGRDVCVDLAEYVKGFCVTMRVRAG